MLDSTSITALLQRLTKRQEKFEQHTHRTMLDDANLCNVVMQSPQPFEECGEDIRVCELSGQHSDGLQATCGSPGLGWG